MLIKEYRIPLPLTVDEYRIAQLYMIAKKSREESKGAGSGVEIIVNKPYSDGPNGYGQYTHKVYHVGSHLPGWFKGLLPKSALTVEEEAWNSYPYTKTRYTCPFVEKFSLEIETYYFPDNGYQDNVFQLTGSDYRNRIVDIIDVVRDQLPSGDYLKEEDPKLFISQKTGRGPLSENWLEEYWEECKGKEMPLPNGKGLMCAYKLCRVEFRYWGMQTKLEKFIHDVALRKTMLRAHIQAWAWQDEWEGLTMEDIRNIEKETQELLKRTMAQNGQSGALTESVSQDANLSASAINTSTSTTTPSDASSSMAKTIAATLGSIEKNDQDQLSSPVSSKKKQRPSDIQTRDGSSDDSDTPTNRTRSGENESRRKTWMRKDPASWRMQSIVRNSDTDSDDEFFDCQGSVSLSEDPDATSLAKWSSLDLLTEEDLDGPAPSQPTEKHDSIFSHTYLQRVVSERTRSGSRNRVLCYAGRGSVEVDASSCPGSPTMSLTAGQQSACSTSVLLLILHAGSVLDACTEISAKKSDITTFRGSFECVMRQHYPSMVGHVAMKLVSCPSICAEGLGILSSLNPYSFDVSPSCVDAPHITHDTIPIGAIPLLASSSSDYQESVSRVITSINSVYNEFIKTEEGLGFNGQVCLIGDSMGSILAYDALCRSSHGRHDSENSILEPDHRADDHGDDLLHGGSRLLSAPSEGRRRSSSTSDHSHHPKLDFEVNELFMFGSPLALVLAYRKIASANDKNAPIPRPAVQQVYNLFHPTDPVAARIEPLLSARFSLLPPINIPRYQKFPLGNGQPYHLLEIIQTNPQIFSDSINTTNPGSYLRRMSEVSIQSTVSGVIDSLPLHTINALTHKWWGAKRLDYALYCPDGLANFPTNALPHLFHASYWESSDVIAFILRQLGRFELLQTLGQDKDFAPFSPNQPREKWIKKRTSVKLKNVSPNHRANDIIVKDGAPQILLGRFMYGPLDMITLAGEKIDIHIMRDVASGEWDLLATEVTDKNGRISYTIPEGKTLGYGLYPIKMVVRGDHTCTDFHMAVVPPLTECVVFSIDGSFTASMSVTGRDPKVRAGAVDVVRHWQELGYLIVYVTGRPDMQQQRVVAWLGQHNFPHGLMSFADGLSTDPLGHKTQYLKSLIQDHKVVVHCAYGSSKDIAVYTSLGLTSKQIYIVGKVSKKHQTMATILSDGYAAHLAQLVAPGGSRSAQGNARMVIPRGHFVLPGHNASLRRRRNAAQRTKSFPIMGHSQELSIAYPAPFSAPYCLPPSVLRPGSQSTPQTFPSVAPSIVQVQSSGASSLSNKL